MNVKCDLYEREGVGAMFSLGGEVVSVEEVAP